MGREKRALHPVETYRRSQKRKQSERKRAGRKEALSKTPLARRDPSKLLVEIERLRETEAKGRLDGPGRLRRKHLEDQFVALNKAREKAGMPSMILPEFDPEEYLNRKKDLDKDKTVEPQTTEWFDEDCHIPLPDDDPLETGVPGLPPYRIFNKVTDGNESVRPTNRLIISAEPSVSKRNHLEAQVDQFLNELDL
ncbi:hypothetical protein PSACC_02241 [Paramicrosporidium saccamoebae]|uniref:Wbp11/ELF5/Saf1 N-terminal domain-containing protein n=1 Tax=Paramicrosporidium saccamoebae TaxID=1246581 RepID=A0A2H9TJP2_9FUNG|nr:hypothetical protein PSACC_02241 [Paramicrosporidium saccamoebae]